MSALRKRCATPARNQFRETSNRAKRSMEDKDAVEVVCRLTPYYGPTPCLTVPGYNDNYVCTVFVSYVEIYNNYCYDLLEPKSILTKRDTRVDINNMVYVEGAREVEVDNSDEALELFCKGEERRRTSDTILNKESSRSHSVFTIRLVMAPFDNTSYTVYPDADPSRIIVSQLSLVDLAGSERRNQRSAVQETVPYRDAKLTMLFKNFFEGSGKIRMIICANPKPSDFEENLNVLAFAEESQTVRITRAEDRLEAGGGARPPVPRRFFSRWNYEIDNISSRQGQDIGAQVRDGEITLRNALCVADYAKVELEELRNRVEKDAEQIASYSAENKRLKIQDICDAPSPSFAQLRNKFAAATDTTSSTVTPMVKRKLVATTSNQVTSTIRESRNQQEPRTPAAGPGFFNPKYHRRSKSAPRILDHQSAHRVPTGGILRVKIPSNAKHVTKPEAHQLQKSSDYILTHQEVDGDGNISTSVVKRNLRVHVESIRSPIPPSCDVSNSETSSCSSSRVVYEL
ncbi:unnamed protein product [Nippostrongylus brasiliensis]|uniref:Kinesin-like protein n=1 Tax=Nippostrongylus brasiliensis TaxID=27835 RepID=A0A0N4YP87_NIPBR|nr:unnamed protein product [Nippostrongylus brasiliensis]